MKLPRGLRSNLDELEGRSAKTPSPEGSTASGSASRPALSRHAPATRLPGLFRNMVTELHCKSVT